MCDGVTLEELEAICAFESRNLAVGELGEEFGLLVVLEVSVLLGQVKLQAREGGNSANLVEKSQDWAILRKLARGSRTRFP